MNLTPEQVRSILGVPATDPVGNAAALLARWQRMVLAREYGELTIRLCAGRETGWEERVTHKEGG
jgi:hypothetical protein